MVATWKTQNNKNRYLLWYTAKKQKTWLHLFFLFAVQLLRFMIHFSIMPKHNVRHHKIILSTAAFFQLPPGYVCIVVAGDINDWLDWGPTMVIAFGVSQKNH